MATPVIMPKQGQSVESCVITEWHVERGTQVKEGDLLFSYETDKASFDEEAKVAGIVLDIFFAAWDEVPVLTNVCVIGEEGEGASEYDPRGAERTAYRGEPVSQENQTIVKPAEPTFSVPVGEGKHGISPRARRLAEELGVDYRAATPTGAEGRIIVRDVVALEQILPTENVPAAVAAELPVYTEVKLLGARKLIGERMSASVATAPQLTLNTSFDATELLDLRKKLKNISSNPELNGITLNDMILYAVAKTLIKYEELNAHLVGDKLRMYGHCHLGVAVDTPRGLLVPTIFDADQKSLLAISQQAKSLIEDARHGSINPDYLQGGTFTVTNLGALGIETFNPIINLPQTGILGIGTIVWKSRPVQEEYRHYPACGLSLTFDHRAVDGAFAARFLQELVGHLEAFPLFLCC